MSIVLIIASPPPVFIIFFNFFGQNYPRLLSHITLLPTSHGGREGGGEREANNKREKEKGQLREKHPRKRTKR